MRRNDFNIGDVNRNILSGCTLIGLGIGIAAGQTAAGLLIGAGVGFLATVAAPFLRR